MALKTLSLPLRRLPGKSPICLVVLLSLLVVLGVVAALVNLGFASRSTVRLHIQRGIDAYQGGQQVVAISEWREAMRQDPTHPLPYRLLSETLLANGEAKEAIPLLLQLVKIAPNTPHLYCRTAEAIALSATSDAALEAAKTAVAKEPDCGKAHALYGMAMSDRANHAVGVSELSRAVVLSPGDTPIALSLAQAQLSAADLEGVDQTILTILAREPNNAKAHYLLGWTYSRKTPTPENLTKATSAFETAYRLNPELTDIPAELGRLQVQSGRYQAALPYLERAWNLEPHADIAFNLAKAYQGLGNAAKAADMSAAFKKLSDLDTRTRALQKRLAVNTTDVEAAIELSECHIQAKNWEEASPLLRELLRIRPDDTRVLKAALLLFQGTGNTSAENTIQLRLAQQAKRGGRLP